MRSLLFLMFIALNVMSTSVFSQNRVAYNLPMQNVIYAKILNPIIIYNLEEGDSIIAPKSVRIIKSEKTDSVNILVSSPLEILVLELRNLSGELKGIMEFKVIDLPNPIASISGKKDGLISLNEIGEARFLNIELPYVYADLSLKIISFKLTVNDGENIKTIENKGAVFNRYTLEALKNLDKGTRVFFEEIVVRMPNRQIVKVPSVILKVI